ncbi:MAG: hypothetical protein ABII90_04965 [Bacteroidota bacterium]
MQNKYRVFKKTLLFLLIITSFYGCDNEKKPATPVSEYIDRKDTLARKILSFIQARDTTGTKTAVIADSLQ